MIEPQLLRSAAEGDASALESLVRELAPSLYAFQSGMLGDTDEAADALQETFVRVARAVERYDPDVDVEAWVFGIARRVAADLRPTPASPPGEAPPADGDVVEWAGRALRALPIELREAIVFREVMRWDPDRIATTLGLQREDVSRRLRAAKTELARGMGGLS